MINTAQLITHERNRGPRWSIVGTIRKDENRIAYATSAEAAERTAEAFSADGLHQVRVSAPVQYDDARAELAAIGVQIEAARAAERDALERAAALTPLAHDDGAGIPQAEIGRILRIDRMTVRKWLGKGE